MNGERLQLQTGLAYEAVLLFLTDELRNVGTPRVYELSVIPVKAGIQSIRILCFTTFSPRCCFLWIFVCAPFIEYLRGNQNLTAILTAITAAVVGVVLNLAVFFTRHTLFTHVRLNWFGIGLALVAFIALLRLYWSMRPLPPPPV